MSLAPHIETLVRQSIHMSSNEFLRLVETVTIQLAKEQGHLGKLQIMGKLVVVPPSGEVTVVGDIHGDLESLRYILNKCRFIEKAKKSNDTYLVFLGDYGDRGAYSPEVYYVILRLKEMFPEKVILMRGNHEGPGDMLAYPHDLPVHLCRKFRGDGSKVYVKLAGLFNNLYNAVLVDKRYIMLHGGVPSEVSSIEDIAYAQQKHPHKSHLEEILWSDPREGMTGTCPSSRGAGRFFGEDVTDRLLDMLGVNVLIRGHEPSPQGFKINHRGKILTLFSRKGAPYYNRQGVYLQLNLSQTIKNAEQLERYLKKF
jgi:diadenosine tetraphosphatase ApaH/serine/threonine PP2A family protein phosphatase